MTRLARIASSALIVSVLAFASASPAVAGKNESPRKHAAQCAKVTDKTPKLQARRDRIAARKPLSDPTLEAERQARIAKLDAKIAAGKKAC